MTADKRHVLRNDLSKIAGHDTRVADLRLPHTGAGEAQVPEDAPLGLQRLNVPRDQVLSVISDLPNDRVVLEVIPGKLRFPQRRREPRSRTRSARRSMCG